MDGRWGDLDVSRQRRVLDTCRNGLSEGTPTPFPDDKTFTTWNLGEAQAFMAVLESWPHGEWLDARMIGRWLPTVLRTQVPKALDAVSACAGKDRAATTAVLIAMIEVELKKGENHMFFARFIPAGLWPGAVAERVVSFAKDEALAASTRAALLEILAAYQSSSALPLAMEWTETNESGEQATVLYRKALDVRLALDPHGAWPLVEADYRQRSAEALRDLSSLWEHRGELGANFSQWPTEQLDRLAQMLTETVPVGLETEHSSSKVVMVGADVELRHLRNIITSMLVQRRLDGDGLALASLLKTDPLLKERFEWEKQQREASRLLGSVSLASESPIPAPAGISAEHVVRLLDEADYRLIRSGNDLLIALVHALRQIDEGAPYDVSMLYGRNEPQKPGPGIKGKTANKQVRGRLDEDALQAYVRRRLEDMLPSRIPGIRIKIYREPQVKYQRRFDLDVVAPTIDREWARVVVEIKWSDNVETKSSLENQLVRKYLIGHGPVHGIYLVGWCGNWKEKGKKGKDIQQLKEYLANRVKSVTASEEGKHLRVEPVVLDLRWRDDLPDQRTAPVA